MRGFEREGEGRREGGGGREGESKPEMRRYIVVHVHKKGITTPT